MLRKLTHALRSALRSSATGRQTRGWNLEIRRGLKFQVMSDLHLEVGPQYESYNITKARNVDHLILSGDVGLLKHYERYRDFLARQCKLFPNVYLVLGNHEFYDGSRNEAFARVNNLKSESVLSNLHILNNESRDVGEHVTILGTTLWSYIPPESTERLQKALADFSRIPGWTVESHNEQHQQDLAWLRTQISEVQAKDPSRRIVVVTHHAPSREGTAHPLHKDSPLIHAFASDVLKPASDSWQGIGNVCYWVFGHTHWNTDFRHESMRVLANQRGYVYTNKNIRLNARAAKVEKGMAFDEEKCIEV